MTFGSSKPASTDNQQNEQADVSQQPDEVSAGDVQDAVDGNSGDTAQSGGKTFSQEDVSKMMAREKQQGRNSVYTKLGIDPDNADMVAKVQEFIKTLAPQGDEAMAAAEQKVREAEARAQAAETRAELLEAGIVTNYVDDAMVLVNAKLDADTDAKAAIGELKKKLPSWFTSTNLGAQQFRGTGSNPKSQENGGAGGDEKGSLGKRLAASKRSTQTKRSYFDRK